MAAENKQGTLMEKEHDFPYAASEARFGPPEGGCVQWHWHNRFEFGVVRSGSILLGIHNASHMLHEGDGYFINSNVLHYCTAVPGAEDGSMLVQYVDRSLLPGTGSIGRRYVTPLENCIAMELFIFLSDCPEHAAMLDHIAAAYESGKDPDGSPELMICGHMHFAWAELYKLATPLLTEEVGSRPESTIRARMMLGFIHQHYAEPVTIKQLAAHTGVCERECFRSFAQYFNTTPMDYLMRYRISMAARRLVETGDPISQIAGECGFSSSSYFSLVFRQIMGKTPREYRKNHSL